MDLHDFDSVSLYFDDACPPEVDALLDTAAQGCVDGEGELPLLQAHLHAPEQLVVLVGLYRYYFYRHRLAEADVVAQRAMQVSGRRLGLPDDWQRMDQIALADAASRSIGLLRFWLLALKARAILALRDGRIPAGRQMLEKLVTLDQHDRLGASALLAVIGNVDAVAASEVA
ncbi:MAG: hypothetical protein KDH15_09570 [Rhodocyclaceae bacterium]|nr:hypothetical protein [Rhodocyclaceae bacterium]